MVEDAEELKEIQEEAEDPSEHVERLVGAVLEGTSDALRLAVRYDADEYEVVYIRSDVDEQFSDPELEERVETLMLKGHGDPPQEGALFDFGKLESTMRLYEEVLVVHFPTGEWSGLVFVFDRQSDDLRDVIEDHLP
jgi:hypothetical protein